MPLYVSILLPKYVVQIEVALANVLGSLLQGEVPYFSFQSFPDNNLNWRRGRHRKAYCRFKPGTATCKVKNDLFEEKFVAWPPLDLVTTRRPHGRVVICR
jgi:hypothetical protein